MLGGIGFSLRGYIIPVLYGGAMGMLVGEWYTRLKLNNMRLEQNDKQLRSLINNLPDFVILKDGEGRAGRMLTQSGKTYLDLHANNIGD